MHNYGPSILLRALLLISTLGLLMIAFGVFYQVHHPPEADYGSVRANQLASRAQLSDTDASVFAGLFYALIFIQSVFWLSRYRLWWKSVWIESVTGFLLIYIIVYMSLVFTRWRVVEALPDEAQTSVHHVFTPIDRAAELLVTPARALQ